jgi:triacylglycerol lipase
MNLNGFASPLGLHRLAQAFASRIAIERDALSRAAETEAVAALRVAMALPLGLAAVIPDVKAGEDVVVLVHGFMATAGAFRPMRAHLEREAGVHVATFTHPPGCTVPRIGRMLADVVKRLPGGARVHVVGHSLGGVAARWYVQELGGHARVTQTVSLASPFGGTPVARKFPWFVGAELRNESRILRRLRTRAHHYTAVPHMSLVAGEDRLVVSVESATFPAGEVIVLPGRGHNSMLFDAEAMRIVARCVKMTQRSAA